MFNRSKKQPSTPEEPVDTVKETTPKRGFIPNSIKFVTKHRLVLAIAIIVVSLAIAIFNVIPVVSINSVQLVNLGAPVRLKDGQIAKLKNGNVSARITHFTNDVCPELGKCFGSTMAVEYELTIDGKKHATGSMTPAVGTDYQIKTVSTDNKSYAIIKIEKTEQ